MASLSAIVPATNEPATLDACVSAIRDAAQPPDELIVITDAAAPGPAAARNEGAQRASGDIIAFIDADVVVHDDAFTRIRAAFQSDPSLVAVFGSYDDTPIEDGVVTGFRNLLHHFVHQSSPGEASTFWAGLGAIRRDVFLAAGGFDADRYHHPSVEDIELGMRLADDGRKVVLDPGLQGTHLKRWSLGQMLSTDLRRRGVPWVLLLLERGAPSRALNLGWRHRLTAGLSFLAFVSAAARRPRLAVASLAALVALNRSFYALLWRRQGPLRAVAGVGLHALHHLAGVASVPVGVVAYLLGSRRNVSK
ncbi:MAG: glycosyl transferase [Thermoleophilia bacterium]|nr:glycosyl transferase [Thermoleophilia bacterium]